MRSAEASGPLALGESVNGAGRRAGPSDRGRKDPQLTGRQGSGPAPYEETVVY